MKIPKTFLSGGRRLAVGRPARRPAEGRRSEQGIALVITLIMLAVTLVMLVAFMALSQRERRGVATTTDTTVARLASDTALNQAENQIVANFLSGFNGLDSANAYAFRMIVSTNYINPYGFNTALGVYGSTSPTNVNYNYTQTGAALTPDQLCQNISNLWFLPRAPVYVPTNQPATGYDFRYYLDLNENGRYDTNGIGPVFSGNILDPYYDTSGNLTNSGGVSPTYIPPTVASILKVGDPEWVGILEHPDQPHGPNNHFIARYAFIAVPAGNALDVNYIHNQVWNSADQLVNTPLSANDGYMRNEGVGSWEINLAGFLADLNTNLNAWGTVVGSGPSAPAGSALYYQYNQPNSVNTGRAFDDARALLSYRYNGYSLPSAATVLFDAPFVFPFDSIDAYSDGPILQITLNTNVGTWVTAPTDGDRRPKLKSWSGADNPNHFFTPDDLMDASKVIPNGVNPLNSFTNRVRTAGNANDTYDRYTYYRMLEELGTDSAAEDGKLNLNYSNAVVTYKNVNGTFVPVSAGVIAGAETNLVPWTPQNFFIAATDRLLRLYTTDWYQADPSNYLATYYGFVHRGYIDATGLGVTNFPNYGVTNQIPSFGITNIPVWVNGSFVYSPAVNRLMQLAANIYDASTNNDSNLPHVFRPIFERDVVGNVFIVGYTNLYSGNTPNTVSGPNDRQLARPHLITDLPLFNTPNAPIHDGVGLVNVYGVPWIIGAKKGFPNFNQLALLTGAQISRKLELHRTSLDPAVAKYTTNQLYVIGLSNQLQLTFWNSYSNNYPGRLTVYASDFSTTVLTNNHNGRWALTTNSIVSYVYDAANNTAWPGSKWAGLPPYATPQGGFLQFNWPSMVLNQVPYDNVAHVFPLNPQWEPLSANPQLDQFGLLVTNYLQTYILDGSPGNYHVVDYVQLRDPVAATNINQALADPNYSQPNNIYYQWSTNSPKYAPGLPYGVIDQIWVSAHNNNAPIVGTTGWSTQPTPMGITTPAAEAAYFGGFFTPTFQYGGKIYSNHELDTQAPYTPSRTVYVSYLMQANDPLVHYLGSDLNSQVGTVANWANAQVYNGIWAHSDDPVQQPLPIPPASPIGGRYQPWGAQKGQMNGMSGVDTNMWNLAYKDPLTWGSDYWDFPTNAYPTVGWIGRVHRGTPWQTVDLKSTNILFYSTLVGKVYQNVGSNTWANWTGNIQRDLSGHYFDAANESPLEDRLLFDIFTTRFNDNSVRGTLPVNVGASAMDGGLAGWSALFSGIEVLSNLNPVINFKGETATPSYTNLVINPASIDIRNSALGKIVASINATRANTNLFPYNGFTHAGDVLQAPALSEFSPFLNPSSVNKNNTYGIGDEAYEWLPQQMMGLVRGSEQRYVLYCYGQTLHPAPNGTVLGGTFFQEVTNYQVTAESVARAVIRVDNANTSQPHVVLESYTVLPPN